MEKDLAVYVLVRNDLPSMNPGKAMAQVHHAGVQMVVYLQRFKSPLLEEYINKGNEQGANNFNTTLVLSATLQQIQNAVGIADKIIGVPCGIIEDPSYPFFVDSEVATFVTDPNVTCIGPSGKRILFVRPEITCGWILLDRNDPVMRSIVAAMPLHP